MRSVTAAQVIDETPTHVVMTLRLGYRPPYDFTAMLDFLRGRALPGVETVDAGRYDIVLQGTARFRILRELDVATPFRQVEAELEPVGADESLALGERSSLELESRRFAEAQGYAVDWEAVGRLDGA